ncbi:MULTISPECIES: nitroreductase/quinone reductase family protein [unclassified Mycolicibacterium]|uniref:nitroreductase/quinone reductase family protein n=1 Tax=unclassified Mycolicibacterium TaxID=2636767 RepID=UPI0012DD7CE8|nr:MULTISPECIES: nitroreductase/quinone reductase family protein [unclassified Mycolicibacterium]MUL84695.1 nitroreductase family deazaflavin-dependent oxidoreductase [Mycolicibacterium sp. CBMA 329]MUL88470.1 nitroreductase family deazaflavin-dependent oxidoreductase [Mycolicibacterium sp. CBMA 331]MUM00191.1 nitroreductase family deazaflavin-dependent oxidoreductase [Mycolicibacterium sp. CBMA 334]MUM27855.1 nitroreductase family deazaflavin-dependent oxidoreductase [Mycolicibacterium sp. CBM
MARGFLNSPVGRWFNAAAVGITRVPVLGRWVGHGVVVIRYTGRRSGQAFETPVSVQRDGNRVTINVMAPDSKNWWRNFLGEGGPLTLLNLDGRDHTGHAVAHRDGQGKVAVTVQLDAP